MQRSGFFCVGAEADAYWDHAMLEIARKRTSCRCIQRCAFGESGLERRRLQLRF
jgi:hypothetical protein